MFAAFGHVQQASRALPHERLPEVEVLWLNRIHCVRETAERLQAHALRHLRSAGIDVRPATALRFDELGRYPELLGPVLAEPEFAHLKAVVLALPGAEAPDGNRPSAQVLYLRDPGAIKAIEVDYGVPLGHKAFRVPTPEELARPAALFNPFAAAAAAKAKQAGTAEPGKTDDLGDLKRELGEMRERLDKLSRTK